MGNMPYCRFRNTLKDLEEFIKETFEMVNGMKSSISLRY